MNIKTKLNKTFKYILAASLPLVGIVALICMPAITSYQRLSIVGIVIGGSLLTVISGMIINLAYMLFKKMWKKALLHTAIYILSISIFAGEMYIFSQNVDYYLHLKCCGGDI